MNSKIITSYCMVNLILVSLLSGVLHITPLQAQEEDKVEVEAELVEEPTEEEPLIIHLDFDIPSGLAVYVEEDHFFEIQDKEIVNLGERKLDLPETVSIPDILAEEEGAETRAIQGENDIILTRHATASNGTEWTYSGILQYQSCSEETCFPPQTYEFTFSGIIGEKSNGSGGDAAETNDRMNEKDTTQPDETWQELADEFEVTGRLTGYTKANKFVDFLDDAKDPDTTGDDKQGSGLAGYTLWLTVLLILLGGLALNLTPCVLPMIPVNLAIIGAGSQNRSRRRGVALGTVYGVAIALTYGLLGAVVVLTGATFGTVNASPWFNLTIALIFVILGIAVMGFFHIDFSGLGSRFNPQKWARGTYVVAFLMGGLSALLAGACVAPIVIAVLVLSTERFADGNFAALLYPFILGLGMGLPWPFAATGISFLPKPGRWMNVVKYVFGIFIIGLAVYYGWTSYTLFRGSSAIDKNESTTSAEESEDGLPWHSDLEDGLRESRESGKPVFIDFWASWCKNCHLMEQTTFKNPDVKRELSNFILVKYQAEKPDASGVKEILDHFKVMGLPTYVVAHPDSNTGDDNR
ncbi:MAG: cytochrome c biogenesis protein CcdA [Lentisphaeria bacterium]